MPKSKLGLINQDGKLGYNKEVHLIIYKDLCGIHNHDTIPLLGMNTMQSQTMGNELNF